MKTWNGKNTKISWKFLRYLAFNISFNTLASIEDGQRVTSVSGTTLSGSWVGPVRWRSIRGTIPVGKVLVIVIRFEKKNSGDRKSIR